uniref:Glycosyl hydrolases family 39 N-terminal catalytic domain-containing protein n=1 Tax=Clastoptera arizonana TaxID=38151 RepID=A0A1B6DBC5_9HEMI
MKTRLLIYFHLLFFLLKECVYQVGCTSTIKINTNQVRVDVVTSNKTGTFKRFWQNTGMSAPGPGRMTVDYLTSRTQKINLALIGALPFRAIAHVRIHWLLDLISVRQVSEKIVYNFKTLDKFVSWLNQNDLYIGFELMGNPGGVFTDLGKNASQFEMWKELVYTIASKYKDKYGLSEIKRWRFETWNEPDLKIYNRLNFDLKGYLNYVQASKEGLNKCSSKLRLSGPAGLFKEKHNHHLCWGLLNHCENQIIQNNSCYIDTITFHKKRKWFCYKDGGRKFTTV